MRWAPRAVSVVPLVDQLRFARAEFVRSLAGVTADEAVQRIGPLHSLSWMIGHLADQEQRDWFDQQDRAPLLPGLAALVGVGQPASTPPLPPMWEAWRTITAASDVFLDALTPADLARFPPVVRPLGRESLGTMLLRLTDHYWFHLGEGQAVRQLLGHAALSRFVGELGENAPYRPEAATGVLGELRWRERPGRR
jgi:DinB superfamily